MIARARDVTWGAVLTQWICELSHPQTILGIESSCDDTAAAVVRGRSIAASIVESQTGLHAAFGGVVPEIAARAHVQRLDEVVTRALEAAELSLSEVDAIAVTHGPGLIGGVVSGVMFAKGLAAAASLPLYGINHLAGHALTPRLTDDIDYPFLLLLASGGHCQFLVVRGPLQFQRLGGTIDDAPGEAFDKVARLIGLGQPGGPAIERAAQSGAATRFAFPRPLLDRPGCDLSFSGLKTAVLRARDMQIAQAGGLSAQDQADLSASFQRAVVDVLAKKSARALEAAGPVSAFCVAGGVAANKELRAALEQVAHRAGVAYVAPPLGLCTDNAAMIAYAAFEQAPHRPADDLSLSARPRMPLDTEAKAMLGSGKKGAKA